jgi:4-amino-4-deoxy-L-arabinose transferase-like glycosyltransferase
MTIVTAGAILVVTLAARRLIDDWRAVAFVPVVLLMCPLMNAIGSLATPVTPACFFQAAALACALLIFAPRPAGNPVVLWLAFGLFIGLALLSKYTSILLGLSIFLALLWTREGRAHLRTPWPWLGALIAVAIFSPVIVWNAQHQWVSFKFQLRHGLSIGDIPPWSSVLAYIGGQFAVSTPIVFFLLMFVLWIYARRRHNPMHVRILLLSTAVPLLFFALSALHHRPEANWPMFAYLPGTLLIAHYLGEHWTRRREAWARLAVIVALFGTIFIHSPELGWALFPRMHMPPWEQQFGWRELAQKVDSLRDQAPVYSVDYSYASELSFYLAGRPDVWPLPGSDRPTAFDDIPGYPPVSRFDRVILVRKQLAGVAMVADWRVTNYLPHVEVIHFDVMKLGHLIRRNLITIASR